MTETTKQNQGNVRSLLRFGVRQKVLLVLLSVLIISLTVNGWVAHQRQKENVLQETKQRGAAIAKMVSTSLAYSVLGYDYNAIQLLLDQVVDTEFVVYAKVLNTKGTTMADAGALPDQNSNVLLFNESIALEGVEVGRLEISLGVDKVFAAIKEERAHQTFREALIILLVGLGEFFALSFIILRPVTIITRSLKNSVDESGEIVGHIDIESRDEFGELAQQFNQLSDDLNDANRRLKGEISLADEKLLKANQTLLKQSLELKVKNKELQTLSLTDPLTGLYNRRQFENIFDSEMSLTQRYGEDLSLMVLDIDHFKQINDTHGHSAGDIVLKEIAVILQKRVRRSDVLCRIGGEEFVLLGKHMSVADAHKVAEKLRVAIENHMFDLGDKQLAVTVSIGLSTVSANVMADGTDEFFDQADTALYYSKEHGRNRVTHYQDLTLDQQKVAEKNA
jgi:diguanylate cyclase (GGDEF)-like protein